MEFCHDRRITTTSMLQAKHSMLTKILRITGLMT